MSLEGRWLVRWLTSFLRPQSGASDAAAVRACASTGNGSVVPSMNTVKLTAAGGVVFRPADDGGFEVAVGRAPSGMWRLPKGKREPGESIIETAAREVGEETGLRVDVGRIVGETGYSFTLPADPTRYEKTVTFYLMRATGGDTAARDGEFDVVEWLPPDEAIRRLTYANEAGILETAVALVAKQDIARA